LGPEFCASSTETKNLAAEPGKVTTPAVGPARIVFLGVPSTGAATVALKTPVVHGSPVQYVTVLSTLKWADALPETGAVELVTVATVMV